MDIQQRAKLTQARTTFEQAFYAYKAACRILGATMRLGGKRGPALSWVNECRVQMVRARRGVINLLQEQQQ